MKALDRDFIKKLNRNGYTFVRKRGSHSVYRNSNGKIITINMPLNRMVAERLTKENMLL